MLAEIITTALFTLLIALPAAYLAFLAAVTLRRRSVAPGQGPPRVRFAILVPAHDEERLIGRTVTSLLGVAYPRDRFSVHVVADSCADATAAAASAAGACVHERNERPGKGAALNWLVDDVSREAPLVDAFVFVDADTRASPGLLRAMARHLHAGAQIVQALNLVDAEDAGALVRLRELAFELHCHLRPLAYQILGGSSGLYGNGMCFTAAACRRFRWSESSVVEDGDLFFRIVGAGQRIALAPDAWVRSQMPGSFGGAGAQAVRWERGRFDHFRTAAPLVWRGARRRDANALLAGLGIFVPPTGILFVASVIGLVSGIVAGSPALIAAAVVSLLSLGCYVWRGVVLGAMPPKAVLRVLLWIPAYAVWKVWIVARAASGRGVPWSRIARAVEG